MLRFFLPICLFLFSTCGFTQTGQVQVDIILFTNTYTEHDQIEYPVQESMQDSPPVIPLQANTGESTHSSYQLVSTSRSKLQSLWSRLNRQTQYQPLFHYTWVQPANNQSPVLLPQEAHQGWTVHGTIRVRQSNYYLLDTKLEFQALNHAKPNFILSQKMRLKPGNTYYLDHPQGGMFINVHKV
jgi:hypothetical protein